MVSVRFRPHPFPCAHMPDGARAVDLVESGETMRAAGLHPLSTVLKTSAVLIRSTTPKNPSLEPLVAKIASRIAGFVASNKYVVCQVRSPRRHLLTRPPHLSVVNVRRADDPRSTTSTATCCRKPYQSPPVDEQRQSAQSKMTAGVLSVRWWRRRRARL